MKFITPKNKLPEKLSAAGRVAIADLEKCEASPEKYVIGMGVWHTQDLENRCVVCLAGAVMAQTFEVPDQESVGLGNFDEQTEIQMQALNGLRRGQTAMAARVWYQDPNLSVFPSSRPIGFYHVDPKAFKRDVLVLCDELEAAGL